MENKIVNEIKQLFEKNVPHWLSVKDAVRISGLSDSSIRRALRSGHLRGNKPKESGKWLIKAIWLEHYLTS